MSVRVLVFATIEAGAGPQFEAAFRTVSARVQGTIGFVHDELIREEGAPESYILLSEWQSREAFLAWVTDPVHPETTAPLRQFWAGRATRKIYDIAVRL